MKRKDHQSLFTLLGAVVLLTICVEAAAAPFGSAFTYQGRLNTDGSAAHGTYDFQFQLFGEETNGAALAGPVNVAAVPVSNGLFQVTLDFGLGAFNGEARWLEIGVKDSLSSDPHQLLNPRQAITASPHALVANALIGAVSATQVTGTLSSASLTGSYDNALRFTNPSNQFAGDGSSLLFGGFSYTNLPFYWSLTGNAGTTPGLHFVGTLDAQPLELRVEGQRALRLEPATSPTLGSMPNIIGGGGNSSLAAENFGVTIAGGGNHAVQDQSHFSTISGGLSNLLASGAAYSVIGGGEANQIGLDGLSADHGTIGGGAGNVIQGYTHHSTIAGGNRNAIQTINDREVHDGTIGGGVANVIFSSDNATIAGGVSNYLSLASNGAFIGGGQNNHMDVWCQYAVIAGGSQNFLHWFNNGSAIGGGTQNRIRDDARYSVVAGGLQNMIGNQSFQTTISGGQMNTVSSYAPASTIAGGFSNLIGLYATGSVVSGGIFNQANAPYSTVAGGQLNIAAGTNSFVSGYGCLASGNHATAMGYNTIASGEYSTAMGPNAVATAHDAIAMGAGTTANGLYSRAMGVASTADGLASTAMGDDSYAGGDSATAMGRSTMANGLASTAMGRETEASGSSSTAMGWRSTASGPMSTAMGWRTTASGLNSTAMGFETVASGDYSAAMGHRAQATNEGSFVWADFEEADFASTGTNQFLIRASGGVGINTDSPQFALHVNGEAGKPGGGAWSVASDARLKKDVRPLEQALARLLQLHGVTYEYRDPKAIHELPGQQTGMIAQEVEKVFPEWVETGRDGMKRLSVRGFEALAVEALRELRAEKDAQISSLEKRLAALEARMAAPGAAQAR